MTETTTDAQYTKSPWGHVTTRGLHLTFITQGDELAAPHPYLGVWCVYTKGCGSKVKAAWLSQSGAR